MAGINDMLGIGRSALSANSERLSTTQNNVANASTPGYRRQRTDFVTLGGQLSQSGTSGVATRGRTVPETFSSRQRSLERGRLGYAQARAGAQSSIQGQIFPPDGGAIQTGLDAFFQSARALSAAPADPALRNDFLARADSLASAFNSASRALDNQGEALASEISAGVGQINDKLETIASLDQKIRETDRSSALEMVDERDRLAQEVSAEIGADVFEREDGTISLITRSGRALVEGARARPLSLARTASDQIEVRIAGGASEPVALDEIGGRLGGLTDAFNEGLGELEAEIDTLAFEFANALNAEHGGGVGLDGNTGRALFDVSATADGAARALSVSADVAGQPDKLAAAQNAGSLPGGNQTLLNMVDLQSAALPSGAAPGERIESIVSGFASEISGLDADARVARAAVDHLDAIEASTTGVSLEEEMIAMTETQRAFQASLKLLDAGQQMFDSILSLKT
jgi:flagellar hook-associated protein 1 FlgK